MVPFEIQSKKEEKNTKVNALFCQAFEQSFWATVSANKLVKLHVILNCQSILIAICQRSQIITVSVWVFLMNLTWFLSSIIKMYI